MKNNLLKITSVVAITLLCIELILRLIGAYYLHNLGRKYIRNKSTQNTKLKILAVGESTTAGLWYEDESYPIQLKELLNQHYKCDECIDVQIISLPGANTSSTLREYGEKLPLITPDIVLFMVGVNDGGYYAYNFDSLLLKKGFQSNKIINRIDKLVASLSNHSKLARLLKLIYVNLTLTNKEIEDTNYIYSISEIDEADLHKRDLFKKTYSKDSLQIVKYNIEGMINITRNTNAIPILMTYHAAHVNDVIRNIAQNNEVLLIDNSIKFTDDILDKAISKKDNWHPNELGYQIITDNIFSFLKEKSLIPEI